MKRKARVPARTPPSRTLMGAPKVCGLLEQAEKDLIAFYLLPRQHWTQLRSTNPLERVNQGARTPLMSSGSSPTMPGSAVAM